MKAKYVSLYLTAMIVSGGVFFLRSPHHSVRHVKSLAITGEEDDDQTSAYIQARFQYEYDILKDPSTGKIPANIIQEEAVQARAIPVKQDNQGLLRTTTLNTYQPAGPINIGGRTRAVAFDKRYGTGGNQVILAGSVSGGIYRSTDGGANWTNVTPSSELRNVTALAQDTRTGSENTWYAGGGESLGNSASGSNAFYFGYGILKSTDNGATWTRLTLNITDIDGSALNAGAVEAFDNAFDLVHKIIVSPNGNVYICGHRRLVRSTNGGASFNVVFAGSTTATSDAGQMDIVSNTAGKLFLAVNGGNPDLAVRGIWTSPSGDANTWVRFAGGQKTLGVDSVDGWRGNSYIQTSGNYNARRIVLALAPSNQNTLYAYYQNGLSQKSSDGAHPEADLFRFNVTATPYTAVNLSANMPDFPGQSDGVDPLAVQGGYDMLVAVKPDNANVVYVGGTNLYRSTDGFASTTNTEWIGGYKKNNPPNAENYANSHPDMHNLVFDPSNVNHAICANDGGLQSTGDITAAAVTWAMVNNYQTLQYYYVAINPASGKNDFIGGAQDNGCWVRYDQGTAPNVQTKVSSGDGGAVAIGSLTSSVSRAYVSSTQGTIIRSTGTNTTNITPSNLTANPDGGFGDFVTYFKLDFDNPENIYYANFNRVFRTKTASTVTSASWEELTGVTNAVNAQSPHGTNVSIRALEVSRGPYTATHVLYVGTNNAKLYRLDNPANVVATATPVDITPTGMTGNVSDIAINPNRDDEVLVTVSNYGATSIWWTNNAKSATPTWTNVEGNLTLPSARSCMIVVKKDASNKAVTEYYVGTSVGLYSTTNISAAAVSWVREGDNVLNYAVITSLDYRPQDNVLLVGTHGNGMFYASTGTPNFTPDVSTGTNDPVRNDIHFIQQAYPALASNRISYAIGNMYTVQKLIITVRTMTGQLTDQKEAPYENGTIDVSKYAGGMYILTITSSDNKQQFVRQFVKE